MAAEYQLAHGPLSFWRLLPDWDFCHWWRSVFIHVCYRFTCHTERLLHCIAFFGALIKPRRNITGRGYDEDAFCWWMFEIRSMVSHYIYLLHTVGLTFVYCFFSNLLQSAVAAHLSLHIAFSRGGPPAEAYSWCYDVTLRPVFQLEETVHLLQVC